MKIALYGRPSENNLSVYINQLISAFTSLDAEVYIYEPFYKYLHEKLGFNASLPFINTYEDINNNIDFIFSIGGDGTLLNTITLVQDSGIPIVGINTGRLGFLASIAKEEFLAAITNIIKGNYLIDERTLLKVETENNIFGKFNYALNEITIQKYDTASMIHIYAYVNDEYLNSYWADGLIISTPTGSTGYSLSCGGPIISPDSENFVITPIAIHNLSVRPIVIPDKSIIKLKIKSSSNNILVGLDSRSEIIDSSVELAISKQIFKINLVKIPNTNFFSTIRNKLMWGLDIRN